MKKFLIVVILFFQASAAQSAWTEQGGEQSSLELNPLRFTNRARCAADSKRPTESVFLLLNNMAAAKALYKLAKARGEDSSTFTKYGIQVYRYSILEMTKLIHRKLMAGELPLLVSDMTADNGHIPPEYRQVMRPCWVGKYCYGLDSYIKRVWRSSSKKPSRLSRVDYFNSKDNFITEKDFVNKKIRTDFNCHYVKKFSPLQAQLYGTSPTKEVLEQIAVAAINSGEKLTNCEQIDPLDNVEVALYQLEIPGLHTRRWKKKGFDYWNSVKIYLSWAYRNAPEMKAMASPFYSVFKGVALEESLMFTSTTCKSVTKPKCDGNNLAKNVIREFAREDYAKEALSLDMLSSVPEGPQAEIINNPIPSINIDELDLAAFSSASEWLKHFKDNYQGTRAVVKKRLIKSVNFLNLVTKKLRKEKILNDLDQQFKSLSASFSSKSNNDTLKSDLYYLCSEFYFSSHEEYSFLKKKLKLLQETKLIDGIASYVSDQKTSVFFDYFDAIAKTITSGCDKLKQKEIWDDSFILDKTGYAKWYTDKVFQGKVKSKRKAIREDLIKDEIPYLYYEQFKTNPSINNVLCVNPSDCARKLIESVVSLYGVAQYANTFFNLEQKIKSPDMFNSYAERTACKVYDPWFKSKSIIFNLLWDVGQAALSATVPGMLYTRASLQPRMVTSLDQLIKDGKIEYDTKFRKEKVYMDLAADFGPMLGVPCSVSVNTNLRSPYDIYRFNGISVGACLSSEDYDLNVRTASDMDGNDGSDHSKCVSCQLNFESVSTSIAGVVQNIGPAFFLFRGLVRLYKALKDPFNIPRSWEANPKYVMETYRRFGEIPKFCVSSLRKGKRCLKNSCEMSVANAIEKLYKGNILSMNFSARYAKVKLSSCKQELKVRVYSNYDEQGDTSCSVKKIKPLNLSCYKALKEKKGS